MTLTRWITGCALLLLLSACAWQEEPGNILLPTLDLEIADETPSPLQARVIGTRNAMPIHYFDGNEEPYFSITPGEHTLFRAQDGARLSVRTALGTPLLQQEVRYWLYRYTGKEGRNRQENKEKLALFDGAFWLSQGEFATTGAEHGSLHRGDLLLAPGELFYLMVDEETLGGREFLVAFTDSDDDGLTDPVEDANRNGIVDAGETDPHNPDTDGDGLPDGLEVALSGPAQGDAPRLDPLSAQADAEGMDDAARYAAWAQQRKICVWELPDDQSDPFLDVTAVEVRPDCSPIVRTRCGDGICHDVEQIWACPLCEDSTQEICVTSCPDVCPEDCV